jgi:hypothetical protein
MTELYQGDLFDAGARAGDMVRTARSAPRGIGGVEKRDGVVEGVPPGGVNLRVVEAPPLVPGDDPTTPIELYPDQVEFKRNLYAALREGHLRIVGHGKRVLPVSLPRRASGNGNWDRA